MKKINNCWYDDNNNSWSCNIETEESAEKKSKTLSGCSDCSDCSYCRDCSDCSYCSDCSGCKVNPQRYVTSNIGSRNSQTTLYWIGEETQVVCGCYRGNLEAFEERVKNVHANSVHLHPYLKEIDLMKYLVYGVTPQGGEK